MKYSRILETIKVILAVFCLALFCVAKDPDDSAQKGQPISSDLNADGSMKRGISGSFDPKGFRMATGLDGAPRFLSETAQSRKTLYSAIYGTMPVDGREK